MHRRHRLHALFAALTLVAGLGVGVAPAAQAQTYLGQLRLVDYCRATQPSAFPETLRVYTVWPHDAGSWRCQFNSRGIGVVTIGFDMNAVCRWQYGGSAYARSYDWGSRNSWACYR